MDQKSAEKDIKSEDFLSNQRNIPDDERKTMRNADEESLNVSNEVEISNVIIDDQKQNSTNINISDEDLNQIFKISQNPSGNIYSTVNEVKIAINVQGCVVEGRTAGSRILNGVDLKCIAGKM
jgi:cytidylate kinase